MRPMLSSVMPTAKSTNRYSSQHCRDARKIDGAIFAACTDKNI